MANLHVLKLPISRGHKETLPLEHLNEQETNMPKWSLE